MEGEYYGLPWPCWDEKHPGSPILYDASKPVSEGGMGFRNRFGMEHNGVSQIADETVTLPGQKSKVAIHNSLKLISSKSLVSLWALKKKRKWDQAGQWITVASFKNTPVNTVCVFMEMREHVRSFGNSLILCQYTDLS